MTDPHRAGAAGTHATGERADALAADEPHGIGDHGGDGEHDDHAHAEEPLGPIDWAAWTLGAGGVVVGVVIAMAFALSTGYLGA